MSLILETERLTLRKMIIEDLPSLADILQDGQTMYAYEGAFNDDETRNWLDKQLARYKEDGFGLWAVVLKENGKMIGQCGITWQDADGKRVLEIGYHLNRAYWHKGYATEAAAGCKLYAFEALNADEVYSIIRETNIASMNVAIRNGMTVNGRFVKRYREVDMPHLIFSVRRNRTVGKFRRGNKNEYSKMKTIEEIKATIIALEKQALELWNNGNPDGFLELSSDDVIYFDPTFEEKFTGKKALTDYYEGFRGKNKIDSFEMIKPVVQVMSDSAVLAYDYEARRDGQTYRMQCTEVYASNLSGQWKIIHTHWSFVLPQ